MERICWYLKGIKCKGMVFNLSNKLVMDCYDNSDFTGLWGHEKPEYPIFATSRTGFVVTFSNLP